MKTKTKMLLNVFMVFIIGMTVTVTVCVIGWYWLRIGGWLLDKPHFIYDQQPEWMKTANTILWTVPWIIGGLFLIWCIRHRRIIPVLAYGLRTDFRGEPFEGSKYLLAWSDNLKELKAICHCGSKATMVVRLDESGVAIREGSQIEIGGNDRYVSMCRKHFKEKFYGEKPYY